MKKRAWYGSFILYFFPILGLFSAASIALPNPTTNSMGSNAFALIWALVIGLFPFYFLPFRFRRTYRKMPLFLERRSAEINDASVVFHSPSVNSETTWNAYSKFAEDPSNFVLYMQGNRMFVPIPKRELSPADIDELRALFRINLPRK